MMNRREFFKLASLAGLAVIPSSSIADPGISGKPPLPAAYEGAFWIFVNAGGGWDPTLLCDPKGRVNEEQVDPVNMYFVDEILSAGAINYAPIGYNDVFFQKYYQDLLIINGIDMQTNGHDSGSRNTWSGKLNEGFPSLAALIAANFGPELPMSYLSFGGYDATAGLVARTRAGNVNALGRTPHYNDTNGKDHWSVTSMMLMGQGIAGNRVIGGTTDDFQPRAVNPGSLAIDDGGVRIEPQHIHYELRKLAGVTDNEFATLFPLVPADEMSGLLG
jgi:hypothetical protein